MRDVNGSQRRTLADSVPLSTRSGSAVPVTGDEMKKRTVRDLDLQGKRVLLRADFNVPLHAGPDGDSAVADDTRIRGALPTVEYCIDRGASVVACSHLGRPQGRVDEALRLGPIAKHLGRLLARPVQNAPDCVGPEVQSLVEALQPGQVLLLENLRFHAEEEANDAGFAAQLAAFAEVYVNDAFGAVHRAHSSIEGVAHLLPAAAGLLLARELEALGSVFADDAGASPTTSAVVSGGAKVSTKLGLLRSVVKHAQAVCIGGAMANTFLVADGVDVADSLVEPEMVEQAREITAAAAAAGCTLLLPLDAVVARNADSPAQARPVNLADERVPAGHAILDVGPRTIEHFSVALAEADTVVWNGPLGLFEKQAFAGGTRALAEVIAELSARTIVAGGETAQAVIEAGVADRIDHISTGGGAALELLEGRELPGVAALPDVESDSESDA